MEIKSNGHFSDASKHEFQSNDALLSEIPETLLGTRTSKTFKIVARQALLIFSAIHSYFNSG